MKPDTRARVDWLQSFGFDVVTVLIYAIYAGVYFGIYYGSPEYLYLLKLGIQLYVAIFMIVRFNPWAAHTHGALDKKIAFTSGVFLLLTLI